MSQLPAGWAAAELGELGEEVRDAVTPEPGEPYELWSVPAFAARTPEQLSGAQIGSAKRAVQPGDVLICKINPRINRVWLVADPITDARQIASPEYLIFRTRSRTLASYLRWYLSSPTFRRWIELSVEGATGSHTRAKSGPILRQVVHLPPVAEQRQIVATIEVQFSRLDSASGALNDSLRRVSILRAAATLAAFDGLPHRRLGDVSTVAGGHTPRGLQPTEGGTIPFYKVGDMNAADDRARMGPARTYLSPEAAREYRVRLWPAGTVIFPKQGGAIATNKKRVLVGEAACDLNTMGVIPSELLNAAFLRLWFETVELTSLSDGSVVAQIKPSRVSDLQVPVPPVDAQLTIVADLEHQLSLIDSLHASVKLAQSRSAALRHVILERAFRGELVPQDSDDEPASVLLERIRAERAAAPKPTRRKRDAA